MRALLALVASLTLLLSLGMASAVHAMEPVDGDDVTCSAGSSAEGKSNSDQGSKDEQGMVHVHGCHGHHIAAETVVPGSISSLAMTSLAQPIAPAGLPEYPGETTLDPPRA
ncbi:MAG TPA: hypothetical protein VN137_08155 [Sphingomonas sp.]|nr:hypothetical protein [Sphingomonas sp.]